MEGGENYDIFEEATLRILTKPEIERAENVARVNDLLAFKLGVGPQFSGGVDLASLLDKVKKVSCPYCNEVREVNMQKELKDHLQGIGTPPKPKYIVVVCNCKERFKIKVD